MGESINRLIDRRGRLRRSGWIKWGRRLLLLCLGLLVGAIIGRIYDTERGPALQPWHRLVPQEMTADDIDRADWQTYVATEERLFREVSRQMSKKLTAENRTMLNRYYPGSLVWPERFSQDWNRSWIMKPEGKVRGAVVLLHGMTDSPYSLRHIGERYRELGYVAVGIRLPAHGTVPGALTDVKWQAWMAAARLAVREATAQSGPGLPLHIVGYSNGGALAMKYALDALQDKRLRMPRQIVLISPMIGITRFARFSGLAGWPAIFPAFAKTAWLDIVPEYNPFKYNSFPVNGARQSWRLTQALQQELQQAANDNRLSGLPPVLTFQSVVDSTVRSRAVVNDLYRYLPANGSELVFFDLNQSALFRPLLNEASASALSRLLPAAPRRYATAIVTGASQGEHRAGLIEVAAGSRHEQHSTLDAVWPSDSFSLSHIALPFPVTDSLYGSHPAPADEYGISLGTVSLRGETQVLIVDMGALMRITSNPFFPWMMERIERRIPQEPDG
jgi:alpha-beta hydrolase superfamily lysophospholipase